MSTGHPAADKLLLDYAKNILSADNLPVGMAAGNMASQSGGAIYDLASEYFAMKKHNYVNLDDYHHCKANFNATQRGKYGEALAKQLGVVKEMGDVVRNMAGKGLTYREARDDFWHDLEINKIGRQRGLLQKNQEAKDACADFRKNNKDFPKRFW